MTRFYKLIYTCDLIRIAVVPLLILQYVIILFNNPVYEINSTTYYVIITSYIVLCSLMILSNYILWRIARTMWTEIVGKYPNSSRIAAIPKPKIPWSLVLSIIVPLFFYLDMSTNFLIILQLIHYDAIKYVFWVLLALLFMTNSSNGMYRTINYMAEEVDREDYDFS